MHHALSERVVTVGFRRTGQSARQFFHLMQELRSLIETAGGQVVKELAQTRPRPDPATLVGSGKIVELAEETKKLGVKTVVFDDDLTAAQQKNIEKKVQAKILDRTRLILDIFAQRARSKEGQLQVELAQLNYLVPRLTGAWRGFSQQVGGIGTRGPGERKIEVERRYVRERIKYLKNNLEDVRQHRTRARLSRKIVPIPQISLVGYTNVGKSTLLNALVGKEGQVYADDKLFATLDPTTRRVKLPSGQWVLFTDTVGFIQKLPAHLIAAFRATLEETTYANLLVHVVDALAENSMEQEKIVLETLKSLGAEKIPRITAYNKADGLPSAQKDMFRNHHAILVSAKNKEGLDRLLQAVENKLDELLLDVSFFLPFDRQDLLPDIYRTGHIISEKIQEGGKQMRMKIDPSNWERISYRLTKEGNHS